MDTILITRGARYIGLMVTGAPLQRGDRVVCLDALLFGGDPILPFVADDRYRLRRSSAPSDARRASRSRRGFERFTKPSPRSSSRPDRAEVPE